MCAPSLPPDNVVRRIVANALLFQLGWFACVLGGDLTAVAATTVILVIHGLWLSCHRREGYLIAIIAVGGIGLDSVLAHFGLFHFQQASLGLIPVWLACLWLLFATTLCHSLSWLGNHKGLAAAFGALGGPASYFAGSQFADVALATPIPATLLLLALIWALLLPLMFVLARRLSC